MRKRICFVLLLMSCSISLCFMSSTYSRYVADTTGNIDILFAKWQILVNDNDITSQNDSQITFVPTIIEDENVASNTVAPTSKGYFDIAIDPGNVDVSFKYDIELNIDNEDIPDLMITKYAIIDSNYVEGDPIDYITIDESNVISGNLLIDNSIDNFSFDSFTVRVYFEWYEGEDELMDDSDDTLVGVNASLDDVDFLMSANIHFEQIIDNGNLGD